MADLFDPIQILIVSANQLARVGLASLLSDYEMGDVIGEAGNFDQLPAQLDTMRPDALLWDLGWDAELGLETMRGLAGRGSTPPIVALASSEDDAQAAMDAGCSAVLGQDSSPDQMVVALMAGLQGLNVYDSLFAPKSTPIVNTSELTDPITRRENEVLQLLAEGLSNKGIAYQLDISEHTVKFHVNALMTKLNAGSRTEAVVQATRLGLIIL